MLFECDEQALRTLFESQLRNMLADNGLGAFILVLANSLQDEGLHRRLSEPLKQCFMRLQEAHRNGTLHGSADDAAVFEALLASGIEKYQPWRHRAIGLWRAALNPLRGLRPRRASQAVFESLSQPFAEERFHFDKPFLKPEILSEDDLQGRRVRTLYQKFPFVPFHLLMLLEPAKHQPQYMTRAAFELAWDITLTLSAKIPGFGAGYNSLGACASVNHLHVHGFVDGATFAIEAPQWRHNGGQRAYPVDVVAIDSKAGGWSLIERLHERNQPYNLFLRGGKCYLIQRQPQGIVALPQWLPDAGWYELAGGFNLVDQQVFDQLQVDEIEPVLGRLMG